MTKSKYINLICVLVTAATLLGTMGLLAAYAVSRDRETDPAPVMIWPTRPASLMTPSSTPWTSS